MRILHLFYNKAVPVGILNQMRHEKVCVEKHFSKVKWDIKVFASQGDYSLYPFVELIKPGSKSFSQSILLRKYAFSWLKNNIDNYDVILFRYSLADPFQFINIRLFKKMYTVHHTLEGNEVALYEGFRGYLKRIFETLNGKVVLKNVRGVVGVTKEIVDYEKDRCKKPNLAEFCWPNGVNLDDFDLANDERGGIAKFMMVASNFADSWNGLDVIVEFLKRQTYKFEFYIIGKISRVHLDLIGDDPRFFVEGVLDSNNIKRIANKCDFGFGSFSLDRKGMREACTLKVREYLSLGLPVLSGHIDSGLPPSFPFYKNIDLRSVNLFDYIKEFRNISRFEVRNASEKYISKEKIMAAIVEWLKNQ